MGIITKVLRAADSEADKLLKRILKGDPNSPYKEVDDLGSFPVARGVNEPAGVEKKKLKAIGPKIEKELRKQDKEKPLKELQKGGTKMGTTFRSGGRVCKIAKRGFGRAYGKNS
jgi:hypothetical protein